MLASVEGKLNLFRNYVDYAINYKLKPIQTNFYEDSSLGFTFKWNLWFLAALYSSKLFWQY